MKVLHLYAGNLFGGIETLLVTMARLRHLAPEMEPEFGLCFPGRLKNELLDAGVPVHDMGAVRVSRFWTVSRARRRLARVIDAIEPNVVITHDSWSHVVFAPAVRRHSIPLAHVVHSTSSQPNILDRLAGRTKPDCLFANSRYTASLAARTFPATHVETWHYPVSSPTVLHSERERTRAEMGTAKGSVVILQSSRLERWKGHSAHLEALGMLEELPGWELWLAGGVQKPNEAMYASELMSLANRAGIAERVRFLGQRTDVPRLMAAADIYCQPNTGPEPFGIVFVEALYAGLPVVTSNFGGGAEIVDETCGILTAPGDPACIARALEKLIRDKALRRAMSTAGPGRARFLCDADRQLNAAAALLNRHAAAPQGKPFDAAASDQIPAQRGESNDITTRRIVPIGPR